MYCRTKKRQFFQTYVNTSKNELEHIKITKNLSKPVQITANTVRKAARKHVDTLTREAQ